MRAAEWMPGHDKIVCAFAVKELPDAWLDALAPGATLVAPVGRSFRDQYLVKVARMQGGELVITEHGAVRYVGNRSPD
jgi:protein-L-isoaspartate O-methyltransferase